uniref:Uncharacterized protein n=1 Tax=Manihot esculenta TaxID=3983 RepID=A0A2C9VGH9_MANES
MQVLSLQNSKLPISFPCSYFLFIFIRFLDNQAANCP